MEEEEEEEEEESGGGESENTFHSSPLVLTQQTKI
jgi:hypothetical protein